jgi:nucleoside phosphorylase
MNRIIRKGFSVFVCVIMLVLTGCASNQVGYLTIADAGVGQIEQLTAKAGPHTTKKTEKKVSKPEHADVVIQVAVTVELDGVLKAFGVENAERCYDASDTYNFTYYRIKHNNLDIAVVMQPYMGMTYCSSLCTRAILAFDPELICMVGICAGRANKVKLGDIVVASSVFDYAEGKQYEDKFAARPKTRSLDYMLSEYLTSEIVDNQAAIDEIRAGFKNAPEGISVSFHSMASGAVVVDDPTVMERIVQLQDDTVALDMEAYALGAAADTMNTKWLVIKTVQDFADGNKSATEGDIRPFAAYSSAKLLQILLDDISVEDWDNMFKE